MPQRRAATRELVSSWERSFWWQAPLRIVLTTPEKISESALMQLANEGQPADVNDDCLCGGRLYEVWETLPEEGVLCPWEFCTTCNTHHYYFGTGDQVASLLVAEDDPEPLAGGPGSLQEQAQRRWASPAQRAWDLGAATCGPSQWWPEDVRQARYIRLLPLVDEKPPDGVPTPNYGWRTES